MQSFDNWIETARLKNNLIFKIFQASQPSLSLTLKKVEQKNSLSTIYSFLLTLGFIKNGILESAVEDNLYVTKILYRSYIEHWLKSQYIWIRYSKEKNNDIGREYSLFCGVDEDLKYGRSIEEINKILGREQLDKDVFELITEFRPDLEKYSKNIIKEKANSFHYKQITKYLLKVPGMETTFIQMIIPEYSELSSFVHGGPQAIRHMINNNRYDEYRGMIRFSLNTYKFFLYQSMSSFAQYEKKLEDYLQQINEIDLNILDNHVVK